MSSVRLFVCLFVYLFACLFAYLLACVLVCLFVCLFACLFAYLLACVLVYRLGGLVSFPRDGDPRIEPSPPRTSHNSDIIDTLVVESYQ